jgi:hypothetical protein
MNYSPAQEERLPKPMPGDPMSCAFLALPFIGRRGAKAVALDLDLNAGGSFSRQQGIDPDSTHVGCEAVDAEEIPDGIIVVDARIARLVHDSGEAAQVVVGVVGFARARRARRHATRKHKNDEEPKATQLHIMVSRTLPSPESLTSRILTLDFKRHSIGKYLSNPCI